VTAVDVLYLCHGRLEFTQASLPTLIANTDWDMVNQFVVYNDAAAPGDPTGDWVCEQIEPIEQATFRATNLGSPVSVMNHYIRRATGEMFAKVDNDIIVPPDWLIDLVDVMESDPDLELLGMQPDMAKGVWEPGMPRYQECSHIGGVGLMRVSAFRGNDRSLPTANGRFGFTEWQHEYEPKRAWIRPDLMTFELDRLPVEPWKSIADDYKERGLNRDWEPYPREMSRYWDWWTPVPTEEDVLLP
jgi:hypothetical protein